MSLLRPRNALHAVAVAVVACGLAAALLLALVPGGPVRPPAVVSRGHVGPEGALLETGTQLAPASTTRPGVTVDGIACDNSEQVLFHIHVHLLVVVDGRSRQLPGGIGIPEPQAVPTPHGSFVASGRCFYWLHTHAADGIIHIESPVARTYTLGEFFAEWHQPLSRTEVAGSRGAVTVFIDGHRAPGDPASVPLVAHEVIQLDVGRPVVPPQPFRFPPGL